MEALPALLNYGSIGILALISIGVNIYQAKVIEKKDKQLLDTHTTSTKLYGDISNVISSINNSTTDLPKKVRDELDRDFKALDVSIQNLKT